MKRLTRLIAVAALVAAGSTGTAVATGSPPAPPPGGPLYLALGDSVANGQKIVYRLRQAAGPETPILTMTYFNPLPCCDLPGGPLPPTVLAMGDGVLRTMNTIIGGVSAANAAVPAEVYGLLGTGDFFDCKHPNETGYAKIATAFETAWQAAS